MPTTTTPNTQQIESFAAPRDLSAYKEEPVPGGTLLAVAYAVMWVLAAIWVGRIAMKLARVEREVRALQDRDPGTAP
jgi:uncharacterized membrane protein YciS (DUF1049 family)